MRIIRLLGAVSSLGIAALASAQSPSALNALRAGCAADAQKFCAGVQPGGGRVIQCLMQNKASLSDQCRQAATRVQQTQNGGAGGPSGTQSSPPPSQSTPPVSDTTAAPPSSPSDQASAPAVAAQTTSTSTSKRASRKSKDNSRGSAVEAKTDSARFLHLKKVQVIANIDAKTNIAAVDLLIPSTWKFRGGVSINTKEGCYNDFYVVDWQADSEDGGTTFKAVPNDTWQYATDPTALHNLTDPTRRAVGAAGKPCPVAKPMKAEEYYRQKVATAFPAGWNTVSIDPYPELNQIARRQLGLTNDSSVQTDAIRARVTGSTDGKPIDGWITVAVATHPYSRGRGTFYDCHAIDITFLGAPKGKLDANDKLLKVMISSIQLEPKWLAYSNEEISKLYQMEAKKEAFMDQAIAAFQAQVVQTLNGVTERAAQGANQAAFAQDQLTRGVQTFRDPTTGRTTELSNLYDHAWSNGSNDYLMTDDPNFNPNGGIPGDWNQLEPVRPSP